MNKRNKRKKILFGLLYWLLSTTNWCSIVPILFFFFSFIDITFAIILDTGYNSNPYNCQPFPDDRHSADSKCWWMLLFFNRICITVHCSLFTVHRRSEMSWIMENDSLKLLLLFCSLEPKICFKLRSNIRFWNPIKFQVIEAAMKTTFGQMSDRIMHRYIERKKWEKCKHVCIWFANRPWHAAISFRLKG